MIPVRYFASLSLLSPPEARSYLTASDVWFDNQNVSSESFKPYMKMINWEVDNKNCGIFNINKLERRFSFLQSAIILCNVETVGTQVSGFGDFQSKRPTRADPFTKPKDEFERVGWEYQQRRRLGVILPVVAFWIWMNFNEVLVLIKCRPSSFDMLPLFRRWWHAASNIRMNWIVSRGATGPHRDRMITFIMATWNREEYVTNERSGRLFVMKCTIRSSLALLPTSFIPTTLRITATPWLNF